MKPTLLALTLILLPMAHAITIDTVYYDPLDESGSEFVVLRNGNATTDITGWRLATPASQSDATLTGMLQPHATYLVADAGWNQSRDDPSWPAADHEETLTLANADGYVRLLDASGNSVDTLGYGDTNTSEGTPHPGASEGLALVRTQDTGDNAADFEAQEPTFNRAGGNATPIEVSVANLPPAIIAQWMEDDDALAPGIQLLPLPGGERLVALNVTIEDNNSLAGVSVTANAEPLLGPVDGTRGTYTGSVSISTTTTRVTLQVSDGNATATRDIPIELLPVVGLRLPDPISLQALPGTVVEQSLTIENTGTTNLTLQIRGERPTLADLLLGEVFYTFQGTEYPLLEEFREHAVNLAPGEEQRLTLRIEAGHVPSGTYTGQILIAGVEA